MTNEERAAQIWPILVQAASQRQILTYGLVSAQIGMKANAIAQPLDLIAKHCAREGLPPLTVLVVKKETGKPAKGLTTSADYDLDRERVFDKKWNPVAPESLTPLR